MVGELLGTGNIYKTDLFRLFNVVQNSQLSYPKQLVISALRKTFSLDSYYHWVADEWGFAKIVDHTDLPSDAGIDDDSTTRIYIGEYYKADANYYPAVIVRSGGTTYVPISMNRERETVLYDTTIVSDGYGNRKTFVTPAYFVFAGAWEGTLNIDVLTRGIRSRDDICEVISNVFMDWKFDEILRASLLIKRVSIGAPSESDDRNDKLYRQTVTLDIRSEWRRQIPVANLVDAINICVDFGNLESSPAILAPNLEINTYVDLVSAISSL